MNVEYIKDNGLILFECISGSKAYGLDLPQSDLDIRGVFVLPEKNYFGLDYTSQVSIATGDILYYELKRFFELLLKNNPNILELLATPEDSVLIKDSLMELIDLKLFLSKRCRYSFAEYAIAQIKRARGLNKKILNPLPEERKTVPDFCYVIEGHGSVPLVKWLESRSRNQENCGLVKIPHMTDIYSLFYNEEGDLGFRGVVSKSDSNEVVVSSVPEDMKPEAVMSFNRNAYSSYAREYREYWEWVKKRNKERYESTVAHGKNYDAKNMMHVFRLLNMAEEIASEGIVCVRRPERDFLLRIRRGEFLYDDLVKEAEEKIEKVKELFDRSDLPEYPDKEKAEAVFVEIRRSFYARGK